MSDSPSLLASSGATPLRARFPAHGARALRAEIEATEDESLLALLHHELGRIYLAAGDYGAAARSALEAHERAPSLSEPLEALITIAHLKGSSSQLPSLLGELARERSDPEQSLRATFEFLAALLVRSDEPHKEADQIRAIVDPMLESGPESGAVWLLAEIAAALVGSAEARARAILGRVGTAQTPEVRGALLERAATVYQEAGDLEAARAALFQAKDEFPHRGLFRRIEELSETEGNYRAAATAALDEAALCEGTERGVPLLRHALWLRRAGLVAESRSVLLELSELLPLDLAGPLLLAALERQEGNLADFLEHLAHAVPLVAPNDQEIFSLALLRSTSNEARHEAFRFVEPKLGHSQIALAIRLWFSLSEEDNAGSVGPTILAALRGTEPVVPALERAITFLETRARGERGLGPRLDEETLERLLPGASLPGLLLRAYFREPRAEGFGEGTSLTDLPPDLARIIALVRQDRLLANPETRAEGMLELRAILAQDPGDLTATIALARALEDKPDEAAFLLVRAAEAIADPKLGAILLLWAGLGLARSGKSERAKRVLCLAERVLPGALGVAAPLITEPDPLEPRGVGALALLFRCAESLFLGAEGDPKDAGDAPESVVFGLLEDLARGERSFDPSELGLSHFDHSLVAWGNTFDGEHADPPVRDSELESGPVEIVLDAIWGMKSGRSRNRTDEQGLRGLLGPSQAEPWFLAEEALESGQLLEGLSLIEAALDLKGGGGEFTPQSQEQKTIGLLKAYQLLASSDAEVGDHHARLEAALDLLLSLKDESAEDETFLLALLAAAEGMGRSELELEAVEKLAVLREDTPEAAELWERAGILRLDVSPNASETDTAFERALERDPARDLSFRWGLERARARGDSDAELRFLSLRANGSLSELRRARLLWEKARVARRAQRHNAELEALSAIAGSEAYQLPVLGRLSQIHLRDGRVREAAECLSKLSLDPRLPRDALDPILSEAVTLLDELSEPRLALTLLEAAPVAGRPAWFKEELARISAQAERYELAFSVFAELNDECDEIPKRLHFARLMLAIARDHLHDPRRYGEATRRVLRDAPLDRDAVDATLELEFSPLEKRVFLGPSLELIKQELMARPLDSALVSRYVELAEGGGDPHDILQARGLGRWLGAGASEPAHLGRQPTQSLDLTDQALLAPADLGEEERRFLSLGGKALASLTQPDLASLDLSYLLGARSSQDSPAFEEVRPWAHAFGAAQLEVAVGGRDPSAWFMIQAEPPLLVVGTAIPWPLSERRLARLAAELVSASDWTLGFISMNREDALSWLGALLGPNGTGDREIPEKQALIRERSTIGDWTHIELLGEGLRARGMTPERLLNAIASRAIRASITAVGHAGALVHVQDLLPDEEPPRSALLADSVRFALGPEMLRLRQKVGLL